MLLRSSSSSLVINSSSEKEFFLLHLTKSASPTRIFMSPTSLFDESFKKMMRSSSENDTKVLIKRRGLSCKCMCMHGLLSQDFNQEVGVRRRQIAEMVEVNGVDGGGGAGNRGGGGRRCGCKDGNGDGFEYWDSDNANGNTDVYYRKMIEANPGNDLLLSNYAKFLKEVRGDYIKAEEYCERAIMENSTDGDALSLYADLLWQTHRDNARAEIYYDQAVRIDPDNCYVLASYAKLLWEVEDEEESGELDLQESTFFQGSSLLRMTTAF